MSSNPLRRYAEKVNHYPAWLSSRLLTWMFRYKVKLAGTARVDIVSTDFSTVTFRQPNYKKVQNHIGSVHAAAMALLDSSFTPATERLYTFPSACLLVVSTTVVAFLRAAFSTLSASSANE